MTTYPMLGFWLVGGSSVLPLGLLLSCKMLVLFLLFCVWSMLALCLGLLSCGLLWLMSPSWLVLIYLFWMLLMAQLGYLHLTKASLRCYSSFWKSSGLVQTVFAIWVSVPMTLYLVDILWWLLHCKYWSVWVGLWYTVMERELSASGVTKASRKGIAPFPWLPSTVNLIAGSMLLICSRNPCLWACCWKTNVSSTYFTPRPRRIGDRPESFSFKMFQVQICNYGT